MKTIITVLPGDYVSGFVDGEGCFYLTFRSETKKTRKGSPVYYRWLPYFAITLRPDDLDILRSIQKTLDCGHVYILRHGGKKQAYFGVQHIDDLHVKILPFFRKHPLRAKKRFDFELWAKALTLLYKNKKKGVGCSLTDHQLLLQIRKDMRAFKSKMSRGYKNTPV